MKVGEYGWVQNHAGGFYNDPVRVKILATGCGGVHDIKVATEFGQILYCMPCQIKSRPSKALSVDPAIPAEVKKAAEKIAEKKIQDFKEKEKQEMEIITEKEAAERKERKNKATFEEVAKAFASLAKASDLEDEHPELSPVINLATEQIRSKFAGGWEA